jgi:hypothetical protein
MIRISVHDKWFETKNTSCHNGLPISFIRMPQARVAIRRKKRGQGDDSSNKRQIKCKGRQISKATAIHADRNAARHSSIGFASAIEIAVMLFLIWPGQ